ncbi:SCO family protein [Rugamonas sp. DEMB1]|uniref:SCO family protein n=1 Tax=Rugamonas sp. DEMB1 TaxID=3039386 RepID=UPI00244D1A9B|nr:SCO family protein [Rugamonas sp. DEMB1]WGG49938.1 SCO family protein [Rugamonas sp. DEMB1]
MHATPLTLEHSANIANAAGVGGGTAAASAAATTAGAGAVAAAAATAAAGAATTGTINNAINKAANATATSDAVAEGAASRWRRWLRGWGPAFAMCALALAGLLLFDHLTRGFQAVTTDGVRRIDLVRAPRALPPIQLVDSSGARFSLADIAGPGGQSTLITLVYTHCVDICRTAASGQAYLQQELRARGLDKQVRQLTISFDPGRDTPEALRAYARSMQADPLRWRFATVADAAELARLLKAFEVVVLPDGRGGLVHNGAIFVADPLGRLVQTYDLDRPDQALADLLLD